MLQKPVKGEGFAPVFQSDDGWLLACSSYKKGFNDFDSASFMGRHTGTYESFLLLRGKAIMLTAGKGDELGEFTAAPVEPLVLTVVEKGEWHCILYDEEGIALITENSNPVKEENFNVWLNEEQKAAVKAVLAPLLG